MRTLIISYDLKSKDADYSSLYETIKSATNWCHYLESFWIIISSNDVEYWTNKIQEKIKAGDRFIVIEVVNGVAEGWLPKKAWEWISTNSSNLR